ncbi:protein transport protein Sec31A isoform X5 [Xenopus laevis]|uniref:Protein transport protein Sec31A n=1 Tax=Xenopus laevis TaxID=8355 RepID=A0A8J1MZL9_XENLA|nr:protein transport protein Sec31A isoform X5 [Xenopus laevis]
MNHEAPIQPRHRKCIKGNNLAAMLLTLSTWCLGLTRSTLFTGFGAQYSKRMKLKEVDRAAMQAWSPSQHHPIYLATGTSAKQLDATFSTNASLEIFELDLANPSIDMKLCTTYSSTHRYHKLIWGPHRMESDGTASGVLIAGGENGNVILYDPTKVIKGDSEVVIAQQDKHTGPVRALDVNSFQTNLVASGANESEIYIWDLDNFAVPMTPGAKSQPLEDISCIAWNRQVQHILASASPSGRATVWDLRKNEPILKVSDHSNRIHCSDMAWHPDVATQMVLSSEDDRLPVIQMWDLRFASSPLRVMESHKRGILAIAWSLADPELLLSSGKDSRILCSNPNTGEVLYELPTDTHWCFDMQWCPRNPAVLSAASFDGRISIYSIMGGNNDSHKQADKCSPRLNLHNVFQRYGHSIESNTMAESMEATGPVSTLSCSSMLLSSSFGNLDPFGTGHPLPPLQLSQQPAQQSTILPLKKAPKWLRCPVGASFSFGGKLVTFETLNTQASHQQQHPQAISHCFHVYVSQVVTEEEFLTRSKQLQNVVSTGLFKDFCQKKVEDAKTDFEKNVWSFLKVNFEKDSRGKYLELLGFRKEDLNTKIASVLGNAVAADGKHEAGKDSDQASDEEERPHTEDNFLGEVSKDDKGRSSRSILLGEFNISVGRDVDGLITQALLTGNFESAVNLCLHDNRMADAIILAIAGGPELLARTQKKYFAKSQSKITRLITAVVTKNWNEIVQSCDLKNWREALAALLTYTMPDEFSSLCDLLGSRLENEGDLALQTQACLCYVCAGNVEKLVSCWTKAQDSTCSLSLQDLIEKVVILRKTVQISPAVVTNDVGTILAQKMTQYASLLAAQGSLAAAMAFLPTDTHQGGIVQLRERLCHAQGHDDIIALSTGMTLSGGSQQHVQSGNDVQYFPQATIAPTVTWSNKNPTATPRFSAAASSFDTQRNSALPPGFNIPGSIYPSAALALGPSVDTSSPSYNMNSQMAPRPPYSQPFLQSQQYSYGSGGPAVYEPQPQSTVSSATPYQNSSFTSTYQTTTQPLYHGPALLTSAPSSSSLPTTTTTTTSFQHGGPRAPSNCAPYTLPTPGSTGTLPATSELPASQRTGPQNGWNDPPVVSRTSKKKILEHYVPLPPITSPIMNPVTDSGSQQQQIPSSGVPLPSIPFQPSTMLVVQPDTQTSFTISQPSNSQSGLPHESSKPSAEGAPGAPIGNTIQAVHTLPAEKIAKNPIPHEHLILKTTFEQTKRKLDDANKRLEYLYDKLREQKLSPAIIAGLHNIARSIESQNYTEGLNIHTHIVSTSNFSETSAFMPVLKVVLTQANKLGV